MNDLKTRLTKWWQRLAKHPHAQQIFVMSIIALTGLAAGSVVAVKARSQKIAEITVSPSPKPLLGEFTIKSPSLSPVIIALSPSPKPAATTAAPKVATKRTFLWGVTIQPFPFTEKNDLFLPEQFRLANELGLKAVRVEFAPNNEAANKQTIDLAHQYSMQLVFVIPFGPKDIFSDPQLTDNAYNYVRDIVAAHKGQAQVWQLATEVASVAIVDGGHYGVDRVDYPESKYQAVSTWLKAATRAVKDADPNARRLINDQWVHVGFFDRYIAEGNGNSFDILGWNWFSDMGTDWNSPIINTKTGQRYALMNKLKSFRKDIWLTEVNRRGGSHDGNEKAQADYIQTMAEKAYNEPAIKAFMPYLLVEDQTASDKEKGYSMINSDINRHWVGGLKEAYNRYKALIAAKK